MFEKLALNEGDTLLDLGCGAGDYSLYAAKIVGESGNVYALDLWQDMLDKVCEEAATQGIHNIHPVVSDIRKRINIPDKSIDACLIATVLHTLDFSLAQTKLFAELKRTIKFLGKLAIIECKKENTFHGPPLHMRISPEELEKGLGEYGFKKIDYADWGTNYMALFVLNNP
ncbi:class I SAM-dependent methyltransferase [Desulfoscipio sp. XC116]|uniref:class I SAM-dependent methyltransferase n=1 Tax=Desulfoscipio sp. XC116 TaxID=3144975 RepID=UPI00325B2E03